MYNSVPNTTWDDAGDAYAKAHADLHSPLLDDANFTMRYLAYATRVLPPLQVFSALVASFLAVKKSELVNGVQLLSPENDPVALRDYWIQMVMVKYCRLKVSQAQGSRELVVTSC